jgi:putative heme degradation protein
VSPLIFDHVGRTVVKVGTDSASVAMWQKLVAAQVKP